MDATLDVFLKVFRGCVFFLCFFFFPDVIFLRSGNLCLCVCVFLPGGVQCLLF